MQTYQDLYTRFTKITSDDSSTNTAFGKLLVNETEKLIFGSREWWFAEKTSTSTSTASQQTVKLPVDFKKLRTVSVTVDSVKHTPPTEIINPMDFDRLNSQGTGTTSDYPQFFHIRNGVLNFYPALSSAGNTITVEYHKYPVDMTADDYTTGTITSITNGATTVTGSGTTWTDAMAGRFIRITSDGAWYEISSRTSDTVIELVKPYEGTTLAAATEAYIIGEVSDIPEGFQDTLWYRPVGIYHMMKEDVNMASFYFSGNKRRPGLYESAIDEMIRANVLQTTQTVINAELPPLNPNDYPRDLS